MPPIRLRLFISHKTYDLLHALKLNYFYDFDLSFAWGLNYS